MAKQQMMNAQPTQNTDIFICTEQMIEGHVVSGRSPNKADFVSQSCPQGAPEADSLEGTDLTSELPSLPPSLPLCIYNFLVAPNFDQIRLL